MYVSHECPIVPRLCDHVHPILYIYIYIYIYILLGPPFNSQNNAAWDINLKLIAT